MPGFVRTSSVSFTRHGGRLTAARQAFPRAPKPWIDLSTGVNPFAWPVKGAMDLRRLPDPADTAALEAIAAKAFGCSADQVVAAPGADLALRLLPALTAARSVAIAEPTYGGHREAWIAAGAAVQVIDRAEAAECRTEALIVVNPNNPDGATVDAHRLQDAKRWLIVDESFVELQPDLSIAGTVRNRTIVLRSFGKFYGLPGLRLGFVVAARPVATRLRTMRGDWPVSAPAIAIGAAAYADQTWADRTRARLAGASRRLDRALEPAGFAVIGGTALFRLVRADDAQDRFRRLARRGILVRPFAERPDWLRFGLPHTKEWPRLLAALQDMR